MTTLTRQEVEEMLKNKPANVTDEQIIKSLSKRGYQIEGLELPSQQKQQEEKSTGILQKTGEFLGDAFGGNVVGQKIGTEIAKGTFGDTVQKFVVGKDLTPEEESLVDKGPSAKEVIADVGRAALNFVPVGKITGLAAKGLGKLGLGAKVANTVAGVGTGGALGAASDVAVQVSEGEEPRLGLGTALGAGIPAASPLASALGRASTRLMGRSASEITGALTGTSAETIEQAFEATRKGGKDLDTYTSALRGKTTPEAIVNTMRENVALVSSQRNELYSNTLDELGDIAVSTQPAKDSFRKSLSEVGIGIKDDGTLDFTNNKLRTVPNAQAKLQQAWAEISNMPETQTLKQIDTTRQAVKGIAAIAGDEPSANLANMLIEDGVRSVRKAGEQVDGYGKMLDNFGETSEFLSELERGLSSGDKATIDQAYRRIATTLKTNNEQRMALVKELDEATGGAILSEISGQQLSEALPRGIFRQISAGLAGGAIVTGGVSASMIPALVLASPRVVGEVVRALGLGVAKTDAIISAIGDARATLIKIGAIGGAEMGVEDSGDLE